MNSITYLNNNYNTLITFLATRASNTSLSLKQDLIGDTLSIGSLNISGSVDVGILKHDNGIALQTSDGLLTYGVLTPIGATF